MYSPYSGGCFEIVVTDEIELCVTVYNLEMKVRTKKGKRLNKHRDELLKEELNYIFSDVKQLMHKRKSESMISVAEAAANAIHRRQEAFKKDQDDLDSLMHTLSTITTEQQ